MCPLRAWVSVRLRKFDGLHSGQESPYKSVERGEVVGDQLAPSATVRVELMTLLGVKELNRTFNFHFYGENILKNTHCSFSIAILLTCLTLMLTSGVTAKEAGFYLQAGVTYWNDLEEPEIEFETDEGGLPVEAEEFVTVQYEIDGSRGQISFGGGYHFNENWSFEAFYVRSPELNHSLDLDVPLDDLGIEESLSLSLNTTLQHTVLGVGTVYDLHLNQYLSLFGKVGIAFTQSSYDSNISFSGQPLPEEEFPSGALNQDEESQEVYGAVGVRIPLKLLLGSTNNSITFSYQFFETAEERETSFEVGFQWNF